MASALSSAGDSNDLESCMRKVLENSGLAEELGKRAQRRAWQTFAEERMIEQHLKLHPGSLWALSDKK